jgi:MraZ protein
VVGVFLGTYSPRLDEKGRLILPAKFRDELSSGVVLTKGQERCLVAYPMQEFQSAYEKLKRAPVADKKARDYQRVLLSAAVDEVPDKQGRITIPPILRNYAGLDRDLCVTGLGDHLEIWDAEAWAAYLEQVEPAFADAAEEVVPGTF